MDVQFLLVLFAALIAGVVTVRAFVRQFTHGDEGEHAAGGCAHCPANPLAARPPATTQDAPAYDLSDLVLRR